MFSCIFINKFLEKFLGGVLVYTPLPFPLCTSMDKTTKTAASFEDNRECQTDLWHQFIRLIKKQLFCQNEGNYSEWMEKSLQNADWMDEVIFKETNEAADYANETRTLKIHFCQFRKDNF